MPRLAAGRLRHRVDIEEQQHEQDPATGEVTTTWESVWQSVPASIEPLSAREFIAAQSTQSQVAVRIVVRHRDGLNAAMRVVHNGKVYNIHGILSDPVSGQDYVTLPCSEGVSDGR